MSGLETAALIAAGGVIYAVAKRKERASTIKATRSGGRTGRIPKKSRLVVMYNNTGAPPLKAEDARTAAAELAGRVVGATIQGNRRRRKALQTAYQHAARRATSKAATRWEQRRASHPPQTVRDKWSSLLETLRRANAERRRRPLMARLAEWLGLVEPSVAEKADPSEVKPDPIPGPDPPNGPKPRPRPNSANTSGERNMTAPADLNTPPGDQLVLPIDWAALVARVTDFQPENDVTLIEWMKAEAAGVVAYAAAMQAARENCINEVGLDPSSLQGITIYADHMSEAADRMSEALTMFFTVYREVLQAAANGVVMPHNGRFMTGGSVS